MKKIFSLLVLLFAVTSVSFASTKEEIMKDLEMYNSDINIKVVDALAKIEQETIIIDNVIEKGAKNDVNASMKIIDNQVKYILDTMQKYTLKIKTQELRDYHNITMEYIKVRHQFLKDATSSYLKNGKITDKEKERITNKYAKTFTELDNKNAEILKKLTAVIHPDQNTKEK